MIRSELIHDICDFLSAVEEEHPVPGHEALLDDWELDIRDYFQHVCQPSADEQAIFDIVLSARREAYFAAFGSFRKQNENTISS